MGTNKRYADAVDRRMDDRIRDRIMRESEPSTLAPVELALDREPLTRSPIPHPVRAWVHYGTNAIQVDGRAVAWTSRAIAVEWDVDAGVHRAWLWISAVTTREG